MSSLCYPLHAAASPYATLSQLLWQVIYVMALSFLLEIDLAGEMRRVS